MQFFARVVLFLVLSFSSIVPAARAQSDQDRAELTNDALTAAIGSRDSQIREERITSARDKVVENAQLRPSERLSATAVIELGGDVAFISNLVDSHQLELVSAEVKVAGYDDNPNFTVGIGPDVFMQVKGDTRTRVTHALTMVREELKIAESLAELPRNPEHVPLADRPIRIYKIDIIGTGATLGDVADADQVLLLLPHDGDLRIREYEQTKAIFEPK